MLYGIVTKDEVTDEIKESLLNACALGEAHVEDFVRERPSPNEHGETEKMYLYIDDIKTSHMHACT